MVFRTRRRKSDGLGFTLLELLLTVSLLIALFAAVVFNFQSAERGADLEEGGRQFEALIRFAAAQAANSGKAVQFRFGDDATLASGSGTNSSSSAATSSSSGSTTNSVNDVGSLDEDWGAKLHVVYEADPVLQPGMFVNLPEAAQFIEALGDRVRIEKVQMPERLLNQATNDLAGAQDANIAATTVTFFPDGSSETADIFLVSKEHEDYRELVVHLDGVTGRIRREMKSGDDLVPVEWMNDTNAQKQDEATAQSSPAVTETSTAKATSQPASMPEDPAFEQPEKAKSENTKTNAFNDFP